MSNHFWDRIWKFTEKIHDLRFQLSMERKLQIMNQIYRQNESVLKNSILFYSVLLK